ncbi:class I SAM-dependent methyltransferase [Yeosuana sp. MJ-SS3]|uniref:Class I SAM-dependent methyltransferase n=1 Tax=Gilvirhabdus luticola TaxID=3079858 RepID=A0ABU3U514_9FLAO|nr:class I SAM-dependent methyltransferase [Yeosuana sp. MJ-SS3]MDU8885500.1 class I SAM-dependent methyltransferase [Yeosuana sp. MJ-SS3]
MWYSLFAYIKFLTNSTKQHGVHSPFVFDVVTKCFYDKKQYFDYKELINYRNALLRSDLAIKITDLGSGSKNTKNNVRKISSIAKNSGSTLKRTKLLYRLVNYFHIKNILELGTSLGIATHAMNLANPQATITTVEGCPNISKFTKTNFEVIGLKNMMLINEDFDTLVPKLTNNAYDLVFFDGNHQKQATLKYFNTLLSTVHNDSIFIFDDIYWSKDMTEAWQDIKQHPKVTITIDTFFWGFVFFRKEQAKEHFTIRM